jgi:hypothetical protein
MKLRALFRLEIILTLLLAEIVMTTFSTFFFTQLDQVVNGDLYRYGLKFDYAWAGQYWAYSRLIVDLSIIIIALTSFVFVFLLATRQNRDIGETVFVSCVFLVTAIAATALSAYFFNKLDYLVNHDLYMYGLSFSLGWAAKYWLYAKMILTLLGGAAAVSTISMTLIIKGAHTGETQFFLRALALHKLDSAKLFPPVLFSSGVLALVLSINYTSSILAFIGLGLVFWGAILYYIRPEKYVKETLLDSIILPSLANLNQIITELGYKGKAVYLPPRYFGDIESSKVYISAQKNKKLPLPEEMQKEEGKVFLKNPEGMVLTPPGVELIRLFEKTLGTSFTKVDLRYLEQYIPKLLIENLEIAQNVQVKTENSRVIVKIEGSSCQNMCKEAKKFSNICGNLGCPLSSAIACALAKATGNPITIESEEQSHDGKTTKIQYGIQEG